MMKTFSLASLCCLPVLALTIAAKPISFDFKDPKNVNNVIFQLDAPLESINGSGQGIAGKVVFDPSKPEATSGTITLDAASLHVGNPVLKEHIHGNEWLDVKKFPEIRFVLTKLQKVRKEGLHHLAEAHGKMTIRDVTRNLVAPIKITYLKDLLIKRNRVPGDLLVIRSKFIVKRDDFRIKPGEKLEKVANEIEISLNVAGAAPAK